MSYLTCLYLPSLGKYFGNKFNSRMSNPPVAQLIVVSCVPMATRTVSVLLPHPKVPSTMAPIKLLSNSFLLINLFCLMLRIPN